MSNIIAPLAHPVFPASEINGLCKKDFEIKKLFYYQLLKIPKFNEINSAFKKERLNYGKRKIEKLPQVINDAINDLTKKKKLKSIETNSLLNPLTARLNENKIYNSEVANNFQVNNQNCESRTKNVILQVNLNFLKLN